MSNLSQTKLLDFTKIKDPRGNLIVGEYPNNLPFIVKRFFIIEDVPNAQIRGEHAHKKCHQLLISIKGSVSVLLDDLNQKKEFILSSPDQALLIEAGIWGIQYNYTSDAKLLVLASEAYDESDYIRCYEEYEKWKKSE